MKTLKLISRFVLGIVFTFSGFLKAVDPHGSEYIFNDYFVDAFKIPSFAAIALPLAIILASFEFLVGICLLFNLKPRLASLGALIFMIIFTPLTLYSAIYSPVKDCGCFGEAIKLTNWQTFIKNVIFLPLSIFLFIKTKGETKSYKGQLDWILAGAFFLLALLFQYYNLEHLPVIDFMPYKVGTYIPDKMIIPAGKEADKYSVFYTEKHMKTGEIKEISDDEFLEQYGSGDTLWEVISASEPKLVKRGYTPPIYNFKAYPVDLNNMTASTPEDAMPKILENENYSFMVVSFDIKKANKRGLNKMSDLLNYAAVKNIETNFLTSSTTELTRYVVNINFGARYYNTDESTLKAVIRSNPGLLLLKKGKIIGKWHYNDIPGIKKFEGIINKN